MNGDPSDEPSLRIRIFTFYAPLSSGDWVEIVAGSLAEARTKLVARFGGLAETMSIYSTPAEFPGGRCAFRF